MKMKNVSDLRNDLLDVYEQIKAGTIDIKIASELSNNAGKIIKTAAIELAYNQFTKQSNKKIPFLETE